MSWRSSRALHGLDEPDSERLGPHERGSELAWTCADIGLALLVAAFAAAVFALASQAALGYRLDGVNDVIRTLALTGMGAMALTPVVMMAADAIDRRRAWRDDKLQVRLPINDPLRRPWSQTPTTPDPNG